MYLLRLSLAFISLLISTTAHRQVSADSNDLSLVAYPGISYKSYDLGAKPKDEHEDLWVSQKVKPPAAAKKSNEADPLEKKIQRKQKKIKQIKQQQKDSKEHSIDRSVAINPQVFEWNPKENCGKNLPNSICVDRRKFFLYFPSINQIQPRKSLFAQSNIGIGFLYFSGLRGSLFLVPSVNSTLKGRLRYNRTPLYEYLIGRRFFPWMQAAFSYQYQGNIYIQSRFINGPSTCASLSANLSINALLAKITLESPYPFKLGIASFTPYIGGGTGVVWQSWSNIQQQASTFPEPNLAGSSFYFRQANPASVAVTTEAGIRAQSVHPYLPLSLSAGIKFNLWGQARNIGSLTKQNNLKVGLFQPLRIKTIYQWAPYLGVQWNFAPCWQSNAPYLIKGKNPNHYIPFVVSLDQFEDKKSIWTQFNGGIGFLYFTGIRGFFNNNRLIGIKPGYSYNRTPLFEYLIGFRLTSWLKPAISYQYQSGVSFQSICQPDTTGSQGTNTFNQYLSQLMINSILLKMYFENPMALIWKNLATTLYAGLGIGANWQSWTDSGNIFYIVSLSGAAPGNGGTRYATHQRLIANPIFCAEAGLRLQSALPNSPYSITLGSKFNYLGQGTNLILASQQDSFKNSGATYSIRRIYQWAPYIGFQWSFYPQASSKAPQEICGKKINQWAPFWTSLKYVQAKSPLWTQFSTGIGFVYFDKVSTNFMLIPSSVLENNIGFRDLPFKRRLTRNPTPLFEYQAGTSITRWIKAALSYQHQSAITVRSAYINAVSVTAVDGKGLGGWLQSNLTLDSISLKCLCETPWPIVMKGIASNLYFGVSGGAAWQTWSQIEAIYESQNPNGSTASLSFKFAPKICASGFLGLDAGLKFQSALLSSMFSLHVGCKYNQWGQARNIGAQWQQSSGSTGFFKPLRIKTIYQWAPYTGVQWNF